MRRRRHAMCLVVRLQLQLNYNCLYARTTDVPGYSDWHTGHPEVWTALYLMNPDRRSATSPAPSTLSFKGAESLRNEKGSDTTRCLTPTLPERWSARSSPRECGSDSLSTDSQPHLGM